jgi:hypothetical protein
MKNIVTRHISELVDMPASSLVITVLHAFAHSIVCEINPKPVSYILYTVICFHSIFEFFQTQFDSIISPMSRSTRSFDNINGRDIL